MTDFLKASPGMPRRLRSRLGFTIVELLMVIGIISILITITGAAIAGSMKKARSVRASALCSLVQQGLATYYAQEGKWPVEPGEPKSSNDSENGYYTYTASEVREQIRLLVEKTRAANPVMDVSGLFVSTSTGEPGTHSAGMDFLTAIHGSPRQKKRIRLNQMYFGYPDPSTGFFRRFVIKYNAGLDTVSVSTQ